MNNEATPASNSTAAKPLRNGLSEPARTTSAFTTHSEEPASTPMPADEGPGGPSWGSDGNSAGDFSGPEPSGLGAGFGPGGGGQGNQAGGGLGRALGGGQTVNRSIEEKVTVTLLPEKEGMFMFQHHNYEVKSARRNSTVVRRYSDFVWLLDCLHKRYPFRQLPLLPPKRVAGKTTYTNVRG